MKPPIREFVVAVAQVLGVVVALCTFVSLFVVGWYYLSAPWDAVCAVFLAGMGLVSLFVVTLVWDGE